MPISIDARTSACACAHETIYVNIIIIINISSASQTNKWIHEFYAISNLFAHWRVAVMLPRTSHIHPEHANHFRRKIYLQVWISWSKSPKLGLDFMRICSQKRMAGYSIFIIIVLHSFRQTSMVMVKLRVMETKMEINKWDWFFHPFKCTDWKKKDRKKSGWKTNCLHICSFTCTNIEVRY